MENKNEQENIPEQEPMVPSTETTPTKQPRKAVLGVLIALLVIAVGYIGYMQFVQNLTVEEDKDNGAELIVEDKAAEKEGAVRQTAATPNIVGIRNVNEFRVVELDDAGNEIQTILSTTFLEPESGVYSLYAVPQQNFQGKVYVNRLIEGDLPSLLLHELDVKTGKIGEEIFTENLPFQSKAAVSLSPTQEYIAVVYPSGDFEHKTYGKHLMVWNLITGEILLDEKLGNDEWFSPRPGYGFAGYADGGSPQWESFNCVSKKIYIGDPEVKPENATDEVGDAISGSETPKLSESETRYYCF